MTGKSFCGFLIAVAALAAACTKHAESAPPGTDTLNTAVRDSMRDSARDSVHSSARDPVGDSLRKQPPYLGRDKVLKPRIRINEKTGKIDTIHE